MLATLTHNVFTIEKIFRRALKKIPGGVNSPVRAWKSVGGSPLFISRGQGSHVFDADKKRYIDFVGSWGPMILGHANAKIIRAITRRAANGINFRCADRRGSGVGGISFAARAIDRETSPGQLRHRSDDERDSVGARVYQSVRNSSNSTAVTMAIPMACSSKPVPVSPLSVFPIVPVFLRAFARETLTAKYNDLQSVQKLLHRSRQRYCRSDRRTGLRQHGCDSSASRFSRGLAQNHSDSQVLLLIFDEVITGFRVALGGAQKLFKIKPDLTCLGKILGGGLPLAAFGGRPKRSWTC